MDVTFECRHMQLLYPDRTNLTSLFTFLVELPGGYKIKRSDCEERGLNAHSFHCKTSIEGEKCSFNFQSPKLHKTFFRIYILYNFTLNISQKESFEIRDMSQGFSSFSEWSAGYWKQFPGLSNKGYRTKYLFEHLWKDNIIKDFHAGWSIERKCDSVTLESSHPLRPPASISSSGDEQFFYTHECNDNEIAYFKVDMNLNTGLYENSYLGSVFENSRMIL